MDSKELDVAFKKTQRKAVLALIGVWGLIVLQIGLGIYNETAPAWIAIWPCIGCFVTGMIVGSSWTHKAAMKELDSLQLTGDRSNKQ